MVVFPHCKINLGLHVLRKRADGYHDLETVFYPLQLKDVLEIIPAGSPQAAGRSTGSGESTGSAKSPGSGESGGVTAGRFFASGLPIPGEPETNLCIKAWHLLKQDFPDLPAVDTWLYKNIPMGAGLGGGSSDGAFMLRVLDQKFRLELGREKLAAYALQLGSDCPFFLYDRPCFATGRGESLESIAVDLSGYSIVLVYPGVHIPTARAFSELRPAGPATSLRQTIVAPVSDWRETLVNDFEEPVFRRHPELRKIKDELYRSGAVYASMTGSGSAFYGLFPQGGTQSLPDAGQFAGYFFRVL